MRLLVTRPEPDASHTVQALRTRGHNVLVAPLLLIYLEPATATPDNVACVEPIASEGIDRDARRRRTASATSASPPSHFATRAYMGAPFGR